MNHTEEDIKVKVVLSFLKALGFEDNELKFEKSFCLRLGRNTVRIDTGEQVKSAQPRLDILVTRNGINLFVVEVKTDSQNLTDDDRDQAISYACLVHPMAPFAIVTNGKESKIYKTVDKAEIERDKATILGYKLCDDLESIYDEAFEYFIGYSHENVKKFSDVQIADGMKTLLGSKADPYRKFIPDLYVPSQKVAATFQAFVVSDKPVFALIGESGSGKTCSMCGLARDLTNNSPVLFYKAQDLMEGPIKSIADDFNWAFSTHYDDVSIFKRINKIFKDKKILVFIDGVDEWDNPDKVEILGNFASKIRDRNFKLVLSCKSGYWDQFLNKKGTPTALSVEVFSPSSQSAGYFIESFDEEEFFELINRYREFYDFQGLFEGEVLTECKRSPFLLRVFFEVARETKCTHLTFSVKEFYDEYYKRVLERIDSRDKSKAENTLKAIAKLEYDDNVDPIDEEVIRTELELNINETILPSLFECNILERASHGSQYRVSFYFKKFRDYIVAYKAEKWAELSTDEFKEIWRSFDLRGVRLDAVKLFYQLADPEKKKVIDESVRVKAEAYLDFYVKILDEHFPGLKHRFSPQTTGAIGFVGLLNIAQNRVVAYGFRAVETGGERIKFIPVEGRFWGENTNLPYLMGASDLHDFGSFDGLHNVDIKTEVLKNEIADQLTNIAERGYLNERSNYHLAIEKTLGIIVSSQSGLHGITHKGWLSRYLPIDFEKIEYGMRFRRAWLYFEHTLIEERKKQGVIKPVWSGATTSYSYSFTTEDKKTIEARARDAALNKTDLKTNVTYTDLNKTEGLLLEALKTVKTRKSQINETIMPDQDAVPTGPSYWFHQLFKPETLNGIVCKLYVLFLEEYKALIETNFPTLKNHFSLYSKMPVHCFLTVNPSRNFSVRILRCRNISSDRNEVTLCSNNEIVFDQGARSLRYKNQDYGVFYPIYENSSINSLLSPTRKFIDIDVPDEFTILRSMVYNEIKNEMPIVLKELEKKVTGS